MLVGLALCLTFALLLPWMMRNQQRLGSRIWLTTNGGITLYDGFNPAADGSSNQSFVRATPSLSAMSEVQRDRFFQRQAVAFIRDHPLQATRLVCIKILRTWAPVPLSESYRTDARYVVVGAVYAVPLFLFTLVGLWRALPNWRANVYLLTQAINIKIVHCEKIGSLL